MEKISVIPNHNIISNMIILMQNTFHIKSKLYHIENYISYQNYISYMISYITDIIFFEEKLSYCIEKSLTKYKRNMKAESGQVRTSAFWFPRSFIVLCNWNLTMNDLIYLHII